MINKSYCLICKFSVKYGHRWKGNKQDLGNQKYFTIYENDCFLIILFSLLKFIYKFRSDYK